MPEELSPKRRAGVLSRLTRRNEAAMQPDKPESAEKLDPLMRAIKAVYAVTNAESTAPEDLERQRAGQELMGRLVSPAIGVRYTTFAIQAGPNALPAEWAALDFGHDKRHVILYCHGGGYTCGQLGYARILAGKLAVATGCDVLAFEYRLAPEHPYPAAGQDALAAWDYLMYQGYGARDVIIAGDSAGGNMALELCLKLKEQGRIQPRAMVLMSPWTDLSSSGKSYRDNLEIDPMITPNYIASVRRAYLGPAVPPSQWKEPCYSPLFADLTGLPPTLVQVGTNEILRSDSDNLQKRMIKQNVYAQLEVYDGCWHVFQQVPTRKAAQAMESIGRFVQSQL